MARTRYDQSTKVCPRCGRDLPRTSEFFYSRNSPKTNAFASWCRECTLEYKTEYRKRPRSVEDVEKQRDANADSAFRTRYLVLSHYSGGIPQCACCGETQYEFLAIDHINGGGNKHREEIRGSLAIWLKRRGLPDGFQVLCHNCNFAKGAYGACPHGRAIDALERVS